MEDLEIFFTAHESNLRKSEIYKADHEDLRKKAGATTCAMARIGGGGTSGGSAAERMKEPVFPDCQRLYSSALRTTENFLS